MYKEHPEFKLPEDLSQKVWRYMARWKFEDLLNREALFFPSLIKLGDQFEGKIPKEIGDSLVETARISEGDDC